MSDRERIDTGKDERYVRRDRGDRADQQRGDRDAG